MQQRCSYSYLKSLRIPILFELLILIQTEIIASTYGMYSLLM